MIFFFAAAAAALMSAYLLYGDWTRGRYRFAFGIVSAIITAFLVLCGLDYRIGVKQPAAERRIIAAAVDVSSSTGLRAEEIKTILEDEFGEYGIEIIPFSSSLPGPENGESTALLSSVRELLLYLEDKYDDEKIAGAAIISDGNETEKITDLKNEFFIEGDYPHNTVYLDKKNSASGFDKSVVFTDVPRFLPLYTKKRITFSVNVTGSGLNAVPVELKLDGKILGSVLVDIKDGHGTGEFEMIIKDAGNFMLEASVSSDSREKITSNNRDCSPVEGIIKGFRVLHISGHPSADTAFIRRGLQNIPGVDMISFYILRTHRQLSNTPQSELSLIPFPTDQLFRKELDNFDLIIMNDFTLSEFLSPLYINNIAGFVRSGGGLLIFGGSQSFLARDIIVPGFSAILPVVPTAGNNWIENTGYTAEPISVCRLTSLAELDKIRGIRFRGLNNVKLNGQANLFCRTSAGAPLIAGIHAGKGRVITVLTDSLWQASYYGGIGNEALLKTFVRYLLGIPAMPVRIFAGQIAFDRRLSEEGMADISAEVYPLNPSGEKSGRITVTPGSPYTIDKNDSMIFEVNLLNGSRLLESYKLINFNEKSDNEHSFVPAGKIFLQQIARAGGGRFIHSSLDGLEDSLKDLKLREPVLISEKIAAEIPIYRHRGIILLFLLLGILSFYLKSRYYE